MKERPENDRNYVCDDQFRELRFNLLHSCSWINNSMRQFLQPHDITPKQYSILRILDERFPESLSIQELRDMLADKMSDASRLVDRLEKKNLLDKFPSDHDRRSNRTRITEKGSELVARINEGRKDLDALIRERLSDGEVDYLNDLLERLR
ncbi:DNA-binding MarR family transcriptional regulator [Lewinella marina]|uniref:MarR family transcriptional regulator n=1 Tax=Neolewinella marina TaxID=438751 RepID=A0A2G0CE10_9BACT|nr:MarR family transcriptional regulator [Neolewinella marina]NJB87485.1 DNA-binding MarR family transcriptional regulator [Neolewinella marina]PHK98209.1 MarR family transcriptional regulator [Neolewinella marina]